MQPNQKRKHSKYSASGAERWFNCQGSVALSEGLPDKDNKWSLEGTRAHEMLERILRRLLTTGCNLNSAIAFVMRAMNLTCADGEMLDYAVDAAMFILNLHEGIEASQALVETRISLDFIHPEMFGTFDGAVIDQSGTLHVFDYKYGKSTVSPFRNLQMCFYGIGLAHKYNWDFTDARLWIIQPRIRSYDGPVFWGLPILELESYVEKFEQAVERVEKYPNRFKEGSWCHWCKAKAICPLKKGTKTQKIAQEFNAFLSKL